MIRPFFTLLLVLIDTQPKKVNFEKKTKEKTTKKKEEQKKQHTTNIKFLLN